MTRPTTPVLFKDEASDATDEQPVSEFFSMHSTHLR